MRPPAEHSCLFSEDSFVEINFVLTILGFANDRFYNGFVRNAWF